MTLCFKVLLVGIALLIYESQPQTVSQDLTSLREVIGALTRQVQLQQLFVEERIRSDGDSGVKQVRLTTDGTRNYHADSHGRTNRLLAIHEHANNDRTVGLGEFVAVLNGVEFRTRHNDFRLYMPNRTSNAYHATEPIPFPDVPPEVENKGTIDEKIAEMREWFLAWKKQDHTTRDYRKYFKPVLCYLEGAWTEANPDDAIAEPFESDRHFVDATDWFDLQEKVRFTSYTGRKDNLENYSYLPTTITKIVNDTIPIFAQWNYRISCHPLSRDLPLNRFRVVDEVFSRLPSKRPYHDHARSRAARFQLNPSDEDTWTDGVNTKKWSTGVSTNKWTLLDELMSEIPGKDNYLGDITDDAFDLEAQSIDPNKPGRLNAAYYHRWFKVKETEVMRQSVPHRAFADANVFMALTTKPNVTGMKLTTCKGPAKAQVCKTVNQKMSYAFPLEIIWLTPLSKWNPYDLHYKGAEKTDFAKTVSAGGRNGGTTPEKAYDGINSRKFYQTPSAFFSGIEEKTDTANTAQNTVGVLDKQGNVRITRPSGTRIFFPLIDGVGVLRQRYPIMPVHGEGSSVWKELGATKDLLMKSGTYAGLFREPLGSLGVGTGPTVPPEPPTILQMGSSKKTTPEPHTHEITLTAAEVHLAMQGIPYTKTTTEALGHRHTITIIYKPYRPGYIIDHCDDYDEGFTRCKDKHSFILVDVTESSADTPAA